MRIKYGIVVIYFDDTHSKYGAYDMMECVIHIKNNKRNGKYIEWYYTDGKLYTCCYYKDDELDGEYTTYDHNSNISTHGYFKNGRVIKEV